MRTCTRTGRHLDTFTRRPGSSVYTLSTEPAQVAASGQVSASSQVATPCSCRLLSHQTLLWHHRLGHPSLPRLRVMHSRLLVSGLPRSLPPLPPSPAPPCLPCVEGRQRATPHSSSFPLTSAPIETLHMDSVSSSVSGSVRTFLSCVCTLTEVGSRAFVRATSADKLSSHGIRCVFLGFPPDALGWQFYHPASRRVLPSQDVTFDESVPFYRLFPYRTAPLPPLPLFLSPGPPPVYPLPPQVPAPSGVSKVDPLPLAEPVDVTVDFGAAGDGAARGAASRGAQPVGAEPGGAERASAELGGPADASPRQSRRREPLLPRKQREWFARRTRLRSGAVGVGGLADGGTGAGGAGATSRGGARATSPHGARVTTGAGGTGGVGAAGPGGARTRGTGAARAVGAGGARDGDFGAGGIGARGTGAGGTGVGDPGVGGSGARDPGAGGAGDRGAGARAKGSGTGDPGAGGTRAGDPEAGGVGAGGARAGGAGAGGTRAGGAGAGDPGAGGTGGGDPGAGGAGAGDPRAGGTGTGGAGAGATGAGGTVQRRPFFVPPPPSSLPPTGLVLCQVLSLLSSTGLTPPLMCPPPHQSQPQLQPDSPLPAPSPYAEQTYSLAERRDPTSCPASPAVLFALVIMFLVSVLLLSPTLTLWHFVLPLFHCEFPCRLLLHPLLLTVRTLIAELVDFAAACHLDYATSLVAESESDCPPSVGGECALGMDILEDRQEEFECLAAAVPHLVAMLLEPEGDLDAPDIPTLCSYAEAIPVTPPGANIVDGMWIFRVKRPPGSPPVFKARYRDYELHSLDFSTTFLQGSLHEEIWLRRPPGFTGSFPAGTQWSLRRPVYGLRQALREWHDALRLTLVALGFAPSTADPSLFLCTDTLLPLFYIFVRDAPALTCTLRLPVLLTTVQSSA
ncbi:unnamed protein product [Closterium sp. NIES-53]